MKLKPSLITPEPILPIYQPVLTVDAATIENVQTILLSLGRDPAKASAGWRSQDPLVVACLLAALGYRVFPCNILKHPQVTHGVNSATCDLRTVCYWGRDWPFRGWCVRTGRYYDDSGPPGIWILDIDDAAGYARLAELEKILGPLPKTWKVMSPRLGGGEHHYFAPASFGPDMKMVSKALIAGGRGQIDQKGRGGYAVTAASGHLSGKRYYWAEGCAPDETPLATLPPAWVEAMDTADEPAPKDISARASCASPRLREAKVDRGGTLIGDGNPEVYGGFQNPVYKIAIQFFFKVGVAAPAEPIIEALREMIIAAPKDPGRDVSRYLKGQDLPRIVERAREFVKQVKENEK